MKTPAKTLIAIALATSCSVSAEPNGGTGKDLPFFNGMRPGLQTELKVLDFSGRSLHELGGEIAATQPLTDKFEYAPSIAYEKAAIALDNAREFIPGYVKMLETQAKARNLDILDIIAKGINFDLVLDDAILDGLAAKLNKGCTTMAFNNGVVGQTIDLPYSLIDDETTWIKTDNFIGMLEDGVVYQGMGKHIGLTLNHLGATSYPTTQSEQLVSVDMLFYAASQKNNVEEVIALFERFRPPVASNFTVADDKGGYAAINVSGDSIVVKRGSNKGVAHTNHIDAVEHKYLKSEADFDKMNKMMGWTFARKEAAELFIKYTPELTVEAMQYAFSQRPINLTVYEGDQFVTVTSYVMDMKQGCVYVAPENPRFSNYTQVCF